MKRKSQQLDDLLARSMRNPFTALNHEPWLKKEFNRPLAKRIWHSIKEETLQHWQKHYPLLRPWPVWILELKLSDVPSNAEQLVLLKKHNLLTSREKALLTKGDRHGN
jgi:hypothetical protein